MEVSMDEKDYYLVIKNELGKLLKKKFDEYYLEITANKNFSNKLKKKIDEDRNIIFSFLKEAAPDITGYVESGFLTQLLEWKRYVFVVVEIKRDKLKLDDIYQIRKYSELFDARLSLLISLKDIPEEIKRLSKAVEQLLSQPDGEKIIIAQFSPHEKCFKEWFPKNPFSW